MKNLRTLRVICAGVAMFSSGAQCFALEEKSESNESEVRRLQIELRSEGAEDVFPEFHGGRLPRNEGPPRVGLSFPGPPPAGPPGFLPPGFLPLGTRVELHPVEGTFAEDRRRIAALTESAERIAQAGLPDVAHGLRERAGQLEREIAVKQERVLQEERQRMEAAMRERQEQARQQPQRPMEQRRAGIERGAEPTPPLRELHEQMEQLRRDMHRLSEQIADLTSLIQQHHNPRTDHGRHEEMDEDGDDEDGDDEDEDGDDEDGDDEDGDDEDGDDEDDDEDGDDEDDDEDDDEEDDDE